VWINLVVNLNRLSPYLFIVYAPASIDKQRVLDEAYYLQSTIDFDVDDIDIRHTARVIQDRLQTFIDLQYRW